MNWQAFNILAFAFWAFCFGFGLGGAVVATQWARAARRLQAKFHDAFDKYNEMP